MNTELHIQYAVEARKQELADAERACRTAHFELPLRRRVARPLGRALFSLGTWLLRYGHDERDVVTTLYRPAGSARLN